MDTQPSPPTTSTKRFTDFALAPDVLEELARAGIETPTPIQEVCIQPIIEGKDVVGKAETGTGKTIGFVAPIVSRIDTNRVSIQALVLTPTRELAQQVAGVFEQLGASRKLGVALLVGGMHASDQVLKLRSGTQVAVGTPGRILDFLEDRTLSLVWCEVVVLDEADRMLDMGFIDDVTKILDQTPSERQTLLFSATIPEEIRRLLTQFMKDPQIFSTASGLATVTDIQQIYIESDFPHKFRTLQKLLDSYSHGTVLIFCNTRRQAIDLDRVLWGHGYIAGALHGEHEQEVRFKTLESFRKGDVKILVATDVASRGLDVEDIACVINYEIPEDGETYVHRIGRTGRAQKAGVAISIVSGKEWSRWARILKDTGFNIERSGPERVRKGGGPPEGRGEGRDHRSGRRRSRHGRGGHDGHREHAGRGAHHRPGEAPAEAGAGAATSGEFRNEGGGGRGGRRRRRGRRQRGGDERELHGGPEEPRAPEGSQVPGPAPEEEFRSEVAAAPVEAGETSFEEYDWGAGKKAPDKEAEPSWPPRTEPQKAKPQRRKLEEVDDDFLRTDYFDVNHSVLRRVESVHGPQQRHREEHARPGEPAGGSHPREHGPKEHGPREHGARGERHHGRGERGGHPRARPEQGAHDGPEQRSGKRRRRRRRHGGARHGAGGGPQGPAQAGGT